MRVGSSLALIVTAGAVTACASGSNAPGEVTGAVPICYGPGLGMTLAPRVTVYVRQNGSPAMPTTDFPAVSRSRISWRYRGYEPCENRRSRTRTRSKALLEASLAGLARQAGQTPWSARSCSPRVLQLGCGADRILGRVSIPRERSRSVAQVGLLDLPDRTDETKGGQRRWHI